MTATVTASRFQDIKQNIHVLMVIDIGVINYFQLELHHSHLFYQSHYKISTQRKNWLIVKIAIFALVMEL